MLPVKAAVSGVQSRASALGLYLIKPAVNVSSPWLLQGHRPNAKLADQCMQKAQMQQAMCNGLADMVSMIKHAVDAHATENMHCRKFSMESLPFEDLINTMSSMTPASLFFRIMMSRWAKCVGSLQ